MDRFRQKEEFNGLKVAEIVEIVRKKTKPVAWLVSNCNTPTYRERYVRELARYIQVDIFGKCGSKKCPRDNDAQCRKMIENEYFFYIVFDNSHCKDYITEKFWITLQYAVVPIIISASTDKKALPDHGFIEALDFSSPKDLANHLHQLMNSSAYMDYFRWKDGVNLTKVMSYLAYDISFCKLCKELSRKPQKPYKSYADLEKWWVTEAKCDNYVLMRKLRGHN